MARSFPDPTVTREEMEAIFEAQRLAYLAGPGCERSATVAGTENVAIVFYVSKTPGRWRAEIRPAPKMTYTADGGVLSSGDNAPLKTLYRLDEVATLTQRRRRRMHSMDANSKKALAAAYEAILKMRNASYSAAHGCYMVGAFDAAEQLVALGKIDRATADLAAPMVAAGSIEYSDWAKANGGK